MTATTQHWALTDEELSRLVRDAMPHVPNEERPLFEELLQRFDLLTQDDFK